MCLGFLLSSGWLCAVTQVVYACVCNEEAEITMRWSVQNEIPVQQGGSTGRGRRCESRGQEGGEAGNCSPGLSSWLWNQCSLGAAQSSGITQGAEGAVPHTAHPQRHRLACALQGSGERAGRGAALQTSQWLWKNNMLETEQRLWVQGEGSISAFPGIRALHPHPASA